MSHFDAWPDEVGDGHDAGRASAIGSQVHGSHVCHRFELQEVNKTIAISYAVHTKDSLRLVTIEWGNRKHERVC